MSGWTCVSCSKQSPEGTRFCGFCGTPAAAAPPAATWSCRMCGTANPEGNAFCGGCGERTQAARTEELRLVTALFADVSGFTTLADTLDVESLHEVITPLVRGLTQIAERYEGFIEKFAGDALLVLYGAPVTHEDDAQRALLAALDMHGELPRLLAEIGPHAANLTIHVGVNTGRVIGRQVGSVQQSDYAVLGDSVILAQRLESACPSGETYVGPTTYELCKDEFEFESVGELTLKGKTKPVHAYRLVGRRRSHQQSGALVGRDRELAAAEAALAAGLVTALVGEPGAGKTRLLAEIRRRAEDRGMTWLSARCLSYGTSLAYWPLTDLLRQELGLRPEADADALAAALPPLLPEAALAGARRLLGLESGGDPTTARRDVHDAVALWLKRYAERGPLVLAVEDVHWADRSTVDLLAELVRTGEAGVSLVLTGRPAGRETATVVGGDSGCDVIDIGPLDTAGVAGVAGAVLGDRPTGALLALLVERSGGNPLHVRELTRSLAESDAVVRTVDGWDLRPGYDIASVPTSVERVFATRLDALSPAPAALLQLASVVGRTARLTLLRAVDETGDLDTTLPALLSAGMLERAVDSGEDAVTFSHALLQEVVYERLLRKRRRELHRRVADVARSLYGDGDDTIALLARHLYLADAGEEAVEPLLQAGRRAAGLYANDEAAVHLERAVEVLEKLGDEQRLPEALLESGRVAELRGQYDAAIAAYQRARERGAPVHASIGAAGVLSKTGQNQRALALLDAELQSAEAGTSAASLWLARARVAYAAGLPTDALDAIQRGLRAAADDVSARAELLLELIRNEIEIGFPEFAAVHGRKAIPLLELSDNRTGLAEALRLVGDAHRKLGRLDEAAHTLRRAMSLTQEMGYLEETAATLVNLGVVYRDLGAIDEGIDMTRRALSIAQRLGHRSGSVTCTCNIADQLMHAGRLEEALEWAKRAHASATQLGHPRTVMYTTVTLAEVQLRLGNHAEARNRAQEGLTLAQELASPEWADLARGVLAKAN